MVVTPSGERSSIRGRYFARILPFTLGLVVGALLLAGLLAALRHAVDPLPGWVVAAGAVFAAAAALRLVPTPRSSNWRVPRGWNVAGETPFALAFGVILGFGVLTAIATAGFYVIVLWALYADWSAALPVLIAFAAGRAVPSHLALLPRFRSDVPMFTWRLARVLRGLRPAEAAPLVALAVTMFG